MQRCIRKFSDKEFVRHVLSHGNDPLNLQLEEHGGDNPGRIVYLITSNDRSNGFFAQHRVLLLALQFADRFGLLPVVSYCNNNAYLDAPKGGGHNNAFEYYFKQPCDISLEAAKHSQNVLIFQDKQIKPFETKIDYSISDAQIVACAQMQQKYIHLRREIQRQLDADIERVLQGKRVLGVHFRGTDFQTNFNQHPKFITLEEQMKVVERVLEEKSCEIIFLATDSTGAVEAYQERFGKKLVFFDDAFRSSSELPVTLVKDEREQHHYRLGYEVLRDMYTLVYCNAFVGVRSQMDFCVLITQKSLDRQFESFTLLDNGINSNLKSAYGAGKKVWMQQ